MSGKLPFGLPVSKIALFTKLSDLEQEAKESLLPLPEQRELLLKKVKDRDLGDTLSCFFWGPLLLDFELGDSVVA